MANLISYYKEINIKLQGAHGKNTYEKCRNNNMGNFQRTHNPFLIQKIKQCFLVLLFLSVTVLDFLTKTRKKIINRKH